MTKKMLLVLAIILFASTGLFAQTPGNNTVQGHWVPISAGFSMAIASSLCGLAQGKAIASAVEGMARHPCASKALRLALLISMSFIEALALYTLRIIFVKVV